MKLRIQLITNHEKFLQRKDDNMINISWEQVLKRARKIMSLIISVSDSKNMPEDNIYDICLYGIPTGGIYAALVVVGTSNRFYLTEDPNEADCFIDDIVDSGDTRIKWQNQYNKSFLALCDKQKEFKSCSDQWVSFPWERMNVESGPEDNIKRILQFIGDDPERDGLKDTPKRVVASYAEIFAGYKQDPKDYMKSFECDGFDELILLKDIEFTSVCEHHMLPFSGVAHIAYIPDNPFVTDPLKENMRKVIGASKLVRILEVYTRRLQIQERICKQVTEALDEYLKPLGSACIIEAAHSCIACRGVKKQGANLVTSSLTGAFREDNQARMELMQLIK